MQQRDEMIMGLFEEIQKTINNSQTTKDAFILTDGKWIDVELIVRSLAIVLKLNLAAMVTTNKSINPNATFFESKENAIKLLEEINQDCRDYLDHPKLIEMFLKKS